MAGKQDIPELLSKLDTTRSDAFKVFLLNELAYEYKNLDRDSALGFARKAMVLAEEIEDESGMGDSHIRFCVIYRIYDELDSALYHGLKGLAIRKKLKSDKTVAGAHNTLGLVYRNKGFYATAILHFDTCRTLYKSLGLDSKLSMALNNIGNLLQLTKQYDQAINIQKEALALNIKLNDSVSIARSYTNLGTLYTQTGSTDSAIWFLEQSLSIKSAEGDSFGIADVWLNFGDLYHKLDKPDEALHYYQSSLKYYYQHNIREGIRSAHHNIGVIKMRLKDYASAQENLNKSLKYLNPQEGTTRLNIYYTLIQLYDSLGYPDSAYFMMKKFMVLKDSIFNSANARIIQEVKENYQVEELQLKYDRLNNQYILEKKDSEIKSRTIFATVISLLLLTTIAILYIRNLRQKQKNALLLKQQEMAALLKELDTRSLDAMLKGQEAERKRIAQDLHDRLGSMLSTMKYYYTDIQSKIKGLEDTNEAQLEKVTSLIDDAADEVRKIIDNTSSITLTRSGLIAALEELKHVIEESGPIKVSLVHFGLEHRLEDTMEVALYRIVQEALSNILKHAKASEVTIQFTRNNGSLNMMVSDNGVGFDPKNTRPKGVGLQNMQNRVQHLKGTLNIDSSPGHGTTINIDIPVKS